MVILAKHVALNAILAIGMTFVIITGGIDLSVGSIVGLCGMVAGYLVLHGIDLAFLGFGYTLWFNTFEIIGIALLVGVLVGAVNGLLITRLNVAPFIATLGTLYVARGLALLSSDGGTFPNLNGNPDYGSASFPALGRGEPPRHHLADLDHDRAGAAPRPTWRPGRRSAATSTRSAATSGARRSRASRSTG